MPGCENSDLDVCQDDSRCTPTPAAIDLPKGVRDNWLSPRLVEEIAGMTGWRPASPGVLRAVDAAYRALTYQNGYGSSMWPFSEPTEESEYGVRGGKP